MVGYIVDTNKKLMVKFIILGPGGIETIAKAEGLECHSHVTGAINATERALPG